MQLNYSQSAYLFLSILLDVRKKFTIFNEVRVVAKKALNKAIKRIITI